MPRKVQDIIPVNRRSIRDIPLSRLPERDTLPKSKKKSDEEPIKIHREHIADNSNLDSDFSSDTDSDSVEHIIPPIHKKKTKTKKFPWAISIIGVVIVLAGFGIAFSGHFAHASFVLVPKTIPVRINNTYIIPKSSSGSFGYEVMTLKGVASTTVPAMIGAYTETKAQGPIKIYNAYSASTQRLVAGTRFAGQSGLIYRLTSSVVIPGYKKNGSSIIPGSVSATIVADAVGSTYNISNSDSVSDMKVVAYKGTARYDTFYGRLVSDVTGGFAGTRTVVDPVVLASTTAEVQKNLSTRLFQQMKTIIPDGYVMFDGTYSSVYDPTTVSTLSSSTAQIKVGATVYGVMFKKVDLANFLAGSTSTSIFGTFGYTSPDIGNISFNIANQNDFSALKSTNLAARVNGTFNIVGAIPVADIKKQLGGMTLSQTRDVLNKYSSVVDLSKSTGEIAPPWISTVPNDPGKISIVVQN